MRTRIRKIATGLPLVLLLAACGQFQSEAEAAPMAVAGNADEAGNAIVADADDADDAIAQTEGMAPADAGQAAWGRLAETDPGLGEAYEVVVASWDSNESKEVWQLLARIEADGSFRLLDPDAFPMAVDNTSSVPNTFYCSSGALDVDAGEVRVRDLHLEARRVSDGRKFGLVATNSQAYADWLGGSREPFQPGTAFISMYKSSGEARVRGTCTHDTEYDTRSQIHHDLSLRPGLNLVRYSHDVFTVSGNDAQSDGWSVGGDSENTLQSVQAFPDDMRWRLYEPHVSVSSDDIVWGQLDGDGPMLTGLRIHAGQLLEGDQFGPEVPVGETGPDGYFHITAITLPQAMLDEASPVGVFFCNAEIDNPGARMIELTFGTTDADGGRWILSGAARREHASLRAGHGGRFQQGDRELRVYYLSEQVQIEDDCEGERRSFHFSPGWNLVRATVEEVDAREGHEDGPWPTRWSEESVHEVPGDMRWYLFPAFPRMDGQEQH